MAEINIYDTKTAGDIQKDVDTIRTGRLQTEQRWLARIAFLFGKQHFVLNSRAASGLTDRIQWELKNEDRKSKTRVVSNRILPLVRSLLSKILIMKSTVTIGPTTLMERDKAAARMGQQMINDFWKNVNKNNPRLCEETTGMMMILKRLVLYMLTMGEGYLKPYYNSKATAKAFLNDRILPNADIGAIETRVLHPFNVFDDPMRRFIIERSVEDVDELEDIYGVKVDSESLENVQESEQKIISLLEEDTGAKYENATRVYHKHILPCKKYPSGRTIVATPTKILNEEDLAAEYKGRFPLVRFGYVEMPLSRYHQGAVEQVIALQEEYNYTLGRIKAYKKWFAGKIMVPRESNVGSKWDDETGQYIFYDRVGGTPVAVPGPAAPQYLIQELTRIKTDMADIMATHDASLGKVPVGVSSGVAMEQMFESDNSQITPDIIAMEMQMALFVDMVLDIAEARYSVPRVLDIIGRDLQPDLMQVKSYQGSDICGNRHVKVSMGSNLPATKEARRQAIMNMKKEGVITPEKANELLEFGDEEGIYRSLDRTQAKTENQLLLQPTYLVKANDWEDHPTHAKVHSDYMKTDDYQKLSPDVQQKFIAHYEEHQQFINREAMAAANIQKT